MPVRFSRAPWFWFLGVRGFERVTLLREMYLLPLHQVAARGDVAMSAVPQRAHQPRPKTASPRLPVAAAAAEVAATLSCLACLQANERQALGVHTGYLGPHSTSKFRGRFAEQLTSHRNTNVTVATMVATLKSEALPGPVCVFPCSVVTLADLQACEATCACLSCCALHTRAATLWRGVHPKNGCTMSDGTQACDSCTLQWSASADTLHSAG